MISHLLNCIFVHVPKCGGTSIETALHPYADESFGHQWAIQHRTYRNRELFALIDRHPHHYLFTAVRNPYQRIVSSWNHFRDRERCSLSEYIRNAKAMLDSGFARLYRQLGANRTGIWRLQEHSEPRRHAERLYPFHHHQTGYHVLPMSYFYPTRPFDFVARHERLDRDWATITHALGTALPLPHLNRRGARADRDLLSPDDYARINRIYADDFVRFGYEMEH